MQIFDHNIGFLEKRQFFRRKLSKIAENCDHNIDPKTRQWTKYVKCGVDVKILKSCLNLAGAEIGGNIFKNILLLVSLKSQNDISIITRSY
jgi:hypothetical protein